LLRVLVVLGLDATLKLIRSSSSSTLEGCLLPESRFQYWTKGGDVRQMKLLNTDYMATHHKISCSHLEHCEVRHKSHLGLAPIAFIMYMKAAKGY